MILNGISKWAVLILFFGAGIFGGLSHWKWYWEVLFNAVSLSIGYVMINYAWSGKSSRHPQEKGA